VDNLRQQQIVCVGHILNTTGRLEEDAERTGLDLVASGVLLGRLVLPPHVEVTRCGERALKGKEARVAAYGLTGAPT
jgi:hypothetical protein